MFKRLIHPTNRRIRLCVGLLLAGLFCIQCTRSEAIRQSQLITAINGRLVEARDDVLAEKIEHLARTDHIALLELCLENYERQYRDYTCTLIKQEIIRGTSKGEQWMDVKFVDLPFSVAMKWLDKVPGGNKLYVPMGDRVLYIEGRYNNQMLVRLTNPLLRTLVGTVQRRPDGSDAMRNTLRPVNLFGFKRSIQSLLKVYRKAKRHGELKEAFGGYMKVAGRKAIVLVRYLPPQKDYPAHKTEIFIDVQALVPTCVKGYDWDGNIIGRYIYKNLKFNVGLAGEQFTPEANGMAEPK